MIDSLILYNYENSKEFVSKISEKNYLLDYFCSLNSGIFLFPQRLIYVQTNCRPARKGGNGLTKEELGALIIDSERHMYVTARAILSDDEDCADAIQETIVKAFSKINSLKQDAYAKTWLIRILINECYNVLRQKSRQIPMDMETEMAGKVAAESQDYSDLYCAVSQLQEELKLPVVLYYGEDFSVREIAQVLEISEGAVQKRLARARQKLKRILESAS